MEGIMKNITNKSLDKITESMLRDPYDKNMYVMVTGAMKLGLTSLIEATMRGEDGSILHRAYGSSNHNSPWNKLYLNPTQIFQLPVEEFSSIDLSTTIGKNAKKPIKLSMPLMITGMGYGSSLNLNVKLAIAKATSNVGISTNTGESGLCREERELSKILIGQFNRYNCLNKKEQLSQLDGIEIQLGQGAWGGAVIGNIPSNKADNHLREVFNLKEGEDANRTSRLKEINSPEEIINLIKDLKSQYDVPVGVKIAGSHYIEKDLEILLRSNLDFITIDGAEGGTSGAPPTLEDHLGLPTLYSLSRAYNFLKEKNAENKVDIIIAGGLRNPGEFLKALALGAKAVYIGSIAVVATLQSQTIKATPFEPTPQLFLYDGDKKDDFDIDKGADTLSNFLVSCKEEMKLALMAMGKNQISELNTLDLVSVDKDLAEALQIPSAWNPTI
ncbi:FMN-binding glutamate synthase family protein [Clostridium sp. MSJ-4]|uniref:FMN-binding glutamate synthase family protein n=2 Tax=Clostridium simiarum TaxID=2841506 RepID=A0ABS6F111_9CLOT|nr:FMN-binding glutamate synthase family protein [Clostridium simiarum]